MPTGSIIDRVVVCDSIEKNVKMLLNESIKKLKYLKKTKIPIFRIIEPANNPFLYEACVAFFNKIPIQKSTAELMIIKLKNRQSHHP
jgi:hypothetical protein